ncbi:hypothetical protein [Geoglobus acetivorans]|uniref:Uncharacterized protein n=1 Tax=Geoglobus acetivorans TaxID=565033 RepID=A0ABZ3H582_GEOAI|nr:hypothetical protein [Geoglobus acetivorans]
MIDRRIVYGFISSILLLVFYASINYLAGGTEAVYWNFRNYLPYIAVIDAGFGIQIALYTHIRSFGKSCNAVASTPVTAGSMVACCLHHVTDFIPFAGVGLGLFLSQYTELFFLIGAASSVVGVAWMLSIVQRWNLYSEDALLSKLMVVDYLKMRNALLVLSAAVLLLWYVSKPYRYF